MSLNGYPEHSRNTILFNMGIYLQRSDPDEWGFLLRRFNLEAFKEAVDEKELETILKSLRKKKYSYQCDQEPLCSFCNVKLCRTRKFGIGSATTLPMITSITKVVGDESMWFVDVEGGRMTLTTGEFHDFKRFSSRCMNDLNILPAPMKNEAWISWLRTQMENAIEIKDEVMYAANDLGGHLTTFISGRLAEDADGVAQNRVWYDGQVREVRFKPEAFMMFLKFRKVNLPKGVIHMFLKSRGLHFGVGKTKDRKSYRWAGVSVTVEEETLIKDKQAKGEQIL